MTNVGNKVFVGTERALRDAQIDPAAVLTRAGLAADTLSRADVRLDREAFFALFRAIEAVSGDALVGLRLASVIEPDQTEPLLLAMLSAPDARGACEVLVAYKRALSEERAELRSVTVSSRPCVALVKSWPDGVEAPPALCDLELAAVLALLRRGVRDEAFAPEVLWLRRGALADRAAYEGFFRCPVRLGCAHDALVFRARDLERPQATHNPTLREALNPYLREHASTHEETLVERVRAAIAQRLRGRRPMVETLSRALSVSERSLQRHLEEQGTSVRALVEQVRREEAQRYVLSGRYTDAEVAFLLGYEDPSSFYRAFRRWNGCAPRAYRAARVGEPR